jgi:glutaredoxin-like protein NrdH
MAREVTLYSKEHCVQCTASERRLVQKEIEFIHQDATTEESLAFIKSLDPAYMRAPILTVYEDGVIVDHWTGYRPDKIDALV